ncbi:MAG TPA: hypothetical protein VKT82_11545 [Ktedonobacterales bacterium]|nr:hypothetical protein [Ktedonobacterales bacterium]
MVITKIIAPFARRLVRHQPDRLALGALVGAVLLLPLVLAACSDTPPPPTGTVLDQLHWCGQQTLLFQDASQTPPATLTDWTQVKAALDFTVYLPQQLPAGTCLVSGEALIHDKVLGSSFGISYLLPGGVSLAFSETAATGQQTAAFQCSPSNGAPGTTPTATPTAAPTTGTVTPPVPTTTTSNAVTLLCLGAKGKTNVVIDSSEAEKDLQTTFNSLQANVDWIPKK